MGVINSETLCLKATSLNSARRSEKLKFKSVRCCCDTLNWCEKCHTQFDLICMTVILFNITFCFDAGLKVSGIQHAAQNKENLQQQRHQRRTTNLFQVRAATLWEMISPIYAFPLQRKTRQQRRFLRKVITIFYTYFFYFQK